MTQPISQEIHYNGEVQTNDNGEVVRVKKTRKIPKEKSYLDEKGYLGDSITYF